MISLHVSSYNGAPTERLEATFDELGGTIGRAEHNQLVLPDPERTISRVHARIVFRGGAFAIVDNGSNPISVNGRVLGAGRESPIAPGDAVQIGGYLLTVSAAGAPAAGAGSDPFADLFGDAAGGLAASPVAAPAATSPAAPSLARDPWATPPAPPAAAWPMPTSAGAGPGPSASPAAAAAGSWPAPSPAPAAPVIPDDWNPFAPEPQSSARPVMGPAAGLGLPIAAPPRAESIDDLFGLGPMTPGTDPLGAAPAQALRLQPGTAGDADPLRALAQGPRPAPPATIGDEGSELHTPMPLPPAAAVDVPVTVIKPAGAVFSWDEAAPVEPHAAPRTVPGVRRAASAPEPEPPARPAVAPSVQAPAPARPAPAAAAAPDELLAALLDGLGAPGLRIEALTPARMHLVGELLRESVRGAVELLVARAALKREMRAQMTMIVARENNPLKFSPSVEVALQHLLGPPAPGFMAPAPAVRDAFDDLRAHQLGVMAGMRAALEGVLQRFDPAQLEGQLTRGSALASLIPSTRKARLWERFQELYAQLNREAQDDFDELFGKAFLRAYEEQLERLQHEPRG